MWTRWIAVAMLVAAAGCGGSTNGMVLIGDASTGAGDMAQRPVDGGADQRKVDLREDVDDDMGVEEGDMAAGTADMAIARDMAVAAADMARAGDMASACTAASNYGAAGAKVGTASLDNSGLDDVISWTGELRNPAAPDQLWLDLFAGLGAFTNGIKPGVYPIAGDELNWRTCGLCVSIATGIDPNTGATAIYLATSGTVTLTSVSGRLTGSLTNVDFEQIDIDPLTYDSTPHASMCKTELTSISFDDVIQ